ncbi:MAG: hypothetical protein K0R54_31 [Clostridiaceae bacterium]|jgi:plasmid segregation protein ParM|nr:hypothetical protein [Clostridiaceae bacterium]
MDERLKNIEDYSTKTFSKFHNLKMNFLDELDIFPIATDIGYGGVKVFSLNGKHIFPAIPIEISDDKTYFDQPTFIKYKDERGKIWYVGDRARHSTQGNIKVDKTVYGDERLTSPEYKVLLRVSIFFGLLKPDYTIVKNKKIKIVTGLPEEHLEDNAEILRNRFSGHHNFQVKIGSGDWIKATFDIEEEDIEVLSQPFGTIFSMAFDKYGNLNNDNNLVIGNNVLVFDGGFHTIDTYLSKIGDQGESRTWDKNAMYNVFADTRNIIQENTKLKLEIGEIDKYIATDNTDRPKGTIKYGKNNQLYDFTADFEISLKYNAEEIIERLISIYDNFRDIPVVICAGGTGKAYYPYLKKSIPTEVILAEKETLNNSVETFDSVFSNVVGFFKFLIGLIISNNEIDIDDCIKEELEDAKKRNKKQVEEVAITEEIKPQLNYEALQTKPSEENN